TAERLTGKVGRCAAVHGDSDSLPCRTRCGRRVGIEGDAHARRLPEPVGDGYIFKSMERRLPLLFYGEVRDVVLQHVVLRLEGGELRYEARVAGRVEDNIPDTEQGKAGRRGEQYRRARSDEPFPT